MNKNLSGIQKYCTYGAYFYIKHQKPVAPKNNLPITKQRMNSKSKTIKNLIKAF